MIAVFILLLVNISCQKDDSSVEQFLESLPHEYPEEVNRFQQVDSVYFGFLLPQTISFDDGTVLLPLLEPQMLLQINTDGELVKKVARSGRGPGEFNDILFINKSKSGEIVVYDQKNQKVVRFDQQLEFVDEFTPKPYGSASIVGIYQISQSQYIVQVSPNDYIFDENKKPTLYLSQYNAEQDRYGDEIVLKERSFAHHFVDDRPAGGRFVPYTSVDLVAYNASNGSFYLYRTDSSKIAKISASFDTLRTIPVDLPTQVMSSAERDSIQQKTRAEQWKILKEKLPDVKTPVEKMKVDSQNRFWLKLNYRGDTQQWLVMNQEGNPQKIVHLPKDGIVTHVSAIHIGVRFDDITFAIYKPVE